MPTIRRHRSTDSSRDCRAVLREQGRPQLLLLTSNYDDLLERALQEAGEPVDVVWYEAKRGPYQGRFLHRPPEGEVVPIERPNEYTGLSLDERTVVLKLHGAIDRVNAKGDSYVITEDSYIEYLVGGDVGAQIPFSLLEKMEDSHFLFLGYSMRDWNLRVILSRIWGQQQLDLKSWAVQREPATAGAREVEDALWRDRGDVDLLYVGLKEYADRLEHELFGPSGSSPHERRLRRARAPTRSAAARPTSGWCPTASRTLPSSSAATTRPGSSAGTCARPT